MRLGCDRNFSAVSDLIAGIQSGTCQRDSVPHHIRTPTKAAEAADVSVAASGTQAPAAGKQSASAPSAIAAGSTLTGCATITAIAAGAGNKHVYGSRVIGDIRAVVADHRQPESIRNGGTANIAKAAGSPHPTRTTITAWST